MNWFYVIGAVLIAISFGMTGEPRQVPLTLGIMLITFDLLKEEEAKK